MLMVVKGGEVSQNVGWPKTGKVETTGVNLPMGRWGPGPSGPRTARVETLKRKG